MKKILILFLLVLSEGSFAQDNNLSIFHRLVIYNSANEVMVVNIKGSEIWVTPGFYQDSVQFTKKGLHDIASTYGMTISSPELKGTFSMRRERGDRREMLIRNIYSCQYLSGDIHFPENQSFTIGEIRWLPMDEALLLIPFEPIRLFMKHTHDHPNTLWGGAINGIRENNEWKYEITEEFYPLFSSKKRKRKKRQRPFKR